MTFGVGKGELFHCLLSIIIIIRSLQILKVFLPEVLCQQTKGSVHWCRGERVKGGSECCDQSTLSKAKQTYIHVRSLQYQPPKVPRQEDSITKHTHLGVYMPTIPFLAVQWNVGAQHLFQQLWKINHNLIASSKHKPRCPQGHKSWKKNDFRKRMCKTSN